MRERRWNRGEEGKREEGEEEGDKGPFNLIPYCTLSSAVVDLCVCVCHSDELQQVVITSVFMDCH